MINRKSSELLGFVCHHLNDEGTVAVIDTPFSFEDQDSLPVYLEEVGEKIRFFDDGEVVSHFMGIGVHLNGWADTKFIHEVAELHGGVLNDQSVLELWADIANTPQAFASYLSALLEMVCWEREFNATLAQRRFEHNTTGKASSTLQNFLHRRAA